MYNYSPGHTFFYTDRVDHTVSSSCTTQNSVAIGPLVIYVSGFLMTLILTVLNKIIGRYVCSCTYHNYYVVLNLLCMH